MAASGMRISGFEISEEGGKRRHLEHLRSIKVRGRETVAQRRGETGGTPVLLGGGHDGALALRRRDLTSYSDNGRVGL